MIELLRLIPHWFFPAIVGFLAWYSFIYIAVTGPIYARYYERIWVPGIIEQTRVRADIAKHTLSDEEVAKARDYGMCLYETIYGNDGFKRDFALYLASFGLLTGDGVINMKTELNKLMVTEKICGPRPWVKYEIAGSG